MSLLCIGHRKNICAKIDAKKNLSAIDDGNANRIISPNSLIFWMPAGMGIIDFLGIALFAVILAHSLAAIITIGLIAHSLYCALFHRPRRAEILTPCDAVKERISWSAGVPSSYWEDDDPSFIVSKRCKKNVRIEKPKCNMHRIRLEYGNLQRRTLASADADTKQHTKKTESLLRKAKCKKISKLRHRRMPKNFYVNDI